jgi:phosphoglycolate phosphatase-like HAD superfamily hydrolase
MERKITKEVDLSNVEYILSDWDGTLVDSMEAYTDSFARTLDNAFQIDQAVSARFFKEEAGKPLSWQMKEAVRRFAHKNIDESTPYEEIFWVNLIGIKPEILPGAKNFLESLQTKGKRTIIWSGTRTDVLGKTIKAVGFAPYVDFYIGNAPGDDKLVKGPGLFAKIAEHFGENPSEMAKKTVVIGDGVGDMEAGQAIGAIIGGYGQQDNPNLSLADFVFGDYDSFLEMLE